MQKKKKTRRTWLLPTVLILFIMEIFTLPLVIELTYAGRSEAPDHVLTYTPGRLVWDDKTGVTKDGSAVLSLFGTRYDDTVESEDGERVVAPGTDGYNIVRLKNNTRDRITYTAVLYQIKENPQLPVEAALKGKDFTDTKNHPLPKKAEDAKVLRSVTGTVGGSQIQDFDIDWMWEYEESDARDIVDTALGDKAAFGRADDVTVGLYIVVEGDETHTDHPDNQGENGGNYITPEIPRTGDTIMGAYLTLLVISGIVLLLLVISRRRERKREEK